MRLWIPFFCGGQCQPLHAKYLVALAAFAWALGDAMVEIITGENIGKAIGNFRSQIGMGISNADQCHDRLGHKLEISTFKISDVISGGLYGEIMVYILADFLRIGNEPEQLACDLSVGKSSQPVDGYAAPQIVMLTAIL